MMCKIANNLLLVILLGLLLTGCTGPLHSSNGNSPLDKLPATHKAGYALWAEGGLVARRQTHFVYRENFW